MRSNMDLSHEGEGRRVMVVGLIEFSELLDVPLKSVVRAMERGTLAGLVQRSDGSFGIEMGSYERVRLRKPQRRRAAHHKASEN